MPQAVAAFIVAAIGVTGAAAAAVTIAVEIAVTVALALVTNALFGPKPKMRRETPIKEPTASRQSGFGEAKLNGVYALFEAVDEKSIDVIALHDGEIDSVTHYYLNDDEVTLDGSDYVISPDGKKYEGSDRCKFLTRLGLPTETAYSEITALYPAWTSAHRGDGVASLALICRQATAKHQQERWPNGVPTPSVAAKLQKVYDPRDVGQTQGDKTTYVWSENPILCLLAYLTDANGGMGLDYDRRILPSVADWIAAADICDEVVTNPDSSTEARYRCAGVYQHDDAPSDVIGELLKACDGWLAPKGDGSFTVQAGQFQNPTVALDDKHVIAENVRYFVPDEEAVNELTVTFTNPATMFHEDQAGPVIQDATDIAERGKIRPQKLELPWVPSFNQARRIGIRQLTRLASPLRGTTKTNLYGLNCLGERYIRRRSDENAALANVVFEVTRVEIDLASLSVSIDWVLADACIDECANDTTLFSTPTPRPTPTPLAAPDITGVTPIYETAVSSATGARLAIAVDSPLSGDLEWMYRTKPSASTLWVEGQTSDITPGPTVDLETTFIQATGNVDVQVAYITAGGLSPWSSTFTVAIAAPSTTFNNAVNAASATSVTASENITAPAMVNLHSSSGLKVRNANATSAGKEAHGFILASVLSGAAVDVYSEGEVTGLSGLTPGADLYLDTTNGQVTATAPSSSGNVVQRVGTAKTATTMDFEPGEAVTLR